MNSHTHTRNNNFPSDSVAAVIFTARAKVLDATARVPELLRDGDAGQLGRFVDGVVLLRAGLMQLHTTHEIKLLRAELDALQARAGLALRNLQLLQLPGAEA